MHKVPDEDANETVLALICLGRLDDLLLDGCRPPPIHKETRTLLLIGSQDEAGIMWSQACSEHAGAPRPPSVKGLLWHAATGGIFAIQVLIDDLDVLASMQSLFFTGIRD